MKRRNRTITVLMTLAMTLAACGGGETAPGDGPATTTNGSPDNPDPTDAPPDSTAPDGGEEGTDASVGRVTIDGTIYEFGLFGPGTRCVPDQFGGFWATMTNENLDGGFGVELWPEGQGGDRVNTVSVGITVDGVKMRLTADPESDYPAVEAGTSLVQSFHIDGNMATGTASFVDTEVGYDASLFPLDPIIGEFEVICGSDG